MKIIKLVALTSLVVMIKGCFLSNLSFYDKCMLTHNDYTICKVRDLEYKQRMNEIKEKE